jgi:hypothetical protein
MNWINILLPIVTLVIGSGLTMLGQAISDRRREASERRVRKEQFRVSNFDVHRTAMLEMQETIQDLTIAIGAENIRRRHSGEYEFFDSFHSKPEQQYRKLAEHMDWMERAGARLKDGGLPKSEANELAAEIVEKSREIAEVAEDSKSYVEESGRYFDGRWAFYDEFVKFIYKLRLCMYRSGSNTVVQYGEAYIQAVATWNERIVSEGIDELYERIHKSRNVLDRALSNALTSGPYDKFKGDEE